MVEITRSAKGHALNERSSRSHCIVTLELQQKAGKNLRKSQFLFVDLAGSERIGKTGSVNLAAHEAKNINTSLLTLGKCISGLNKNLQVVPFRESALTMLMKGSLTGNCRTSLIVTAANDPDMIGESFSSLGFGISCGHLKTAGVSHVVNADENEKRLKYKL